MTISFSMNHKKIKAVLSKNFDSSHTVPLLCLKVPLLNTVLGFNQKHNKGCVERTCGSVFCQDIMMKMSAVCRTYREGKDAPWWRFAFSVILSL